MFSLNIFFFLLVLSEANEIIKFFNNQHRAHAMFDDARKANTGEAVKKLSVAVPTRWYSQYDSGKRLLDAKYVLSKICDENPEELKSISPLKAPAVIRLIKSDVFWTKLSTAMLLIEHPVKIIGKLEADSADLALVHSHFAKLNQHFQNDRDTLAKVKKRWDFIKTAVHGLAYILVPKNAAEGDFIDDKGGVMSSVKIFASRTSNAEDAEETLKQMVSYVHEMSNLVGVQKEMIYNMSAAEYWSIFGKFKYPLLYKCANPINHMICSSASAERAWSIFGFIHSALRNRLVNEKVDKLAFIYINSGFMDEIDKTDYILEDGITLRYEDFDD